MSMLRSILSRVGWRTILLPLALGLGVAAYELFCIPVPTGAWIRPGTYVLTWLVFAMAATLGTLAADETVERGARPAAAHTIAFGAALLSCALLLGTLWQRHPGWFDPSHPFSWFRVLASAVDWTEFGGFAVAGYVNRQIANRILGSVHAAQLRRVRLEQQLVASRLAATEAQVDPQLLVASLAGIGAALERDEPDALQRLDALIQELRTMLTRTLAAGDGEASPS